MSTTIWKITNLQRNQTDGGVIVAAWNCSAVEDNFTGSLNGSTAFKYDATSEDFIPFDQLTEDLVLQWVFNSIDVDGINKDVLGQIENQKNEPIIGVPWN